MSTCETVAYACTSNQMKAELFWLLCHFRKTHIASLSKSGFLGVEETRSKGIDKQNCQRGKADSIVNSLKAIII